jgi:hypothetical protein
MLKWSLISVLIIWSNPEGDEIRFMPRVSLPTQTEAACLEKKAEVEEYMTDLYHNPNFAGHLLKCVQINRIEPEGKAI